jgi:hypothetical protein
MKKKNEGTYRLWIRICITKSNSFQVDLEFLLGIEGVDIVCNGRHVFPCIRLRRMNTEMDAHRLMLTQLHVPELTKMTISSSNRT